ncbi:bolA-like family protein [Neorickettsia helminthoeca str. Oregon]|uniref:BolA-like family protein n=1 Tax=Neorickettsia helminthoeca str. Oregon TaxID=1286528 RepID=X5HMH3_9RICK|nr:BolA family protein [Neorickettsia helminthoeca]AHX11670.1 bolA-like family protein [Neorickettsia helminthoeca str. Oregon]
MEIENAIRSALNVVYCDVKNTSEEHFGHTGYSKNSHFEVVVVSSDFDGLTRVVRHKMLFKILEKYLNNGVHAISMKLWTVDEYKNQ